MQVGGFLTVKKNASASGVKKGSRAKWRSSFCWKFLWLEKKSFSTLSTQDMLLSNHLKCSTVVTSRYSAHICFLFIFCFADIYDNRFLKTDIFSSTPFFWFFFFQFKVSFIKIRIDHLWKLWETNMLETGTERFSRLMLWTDLIDRVVVDVDDPVEVAHHDLDHFPELGKVKPFLLLIHVHVHSNGCQIAHSYLYSK